MHNLIQLGTQYLLKLDTGKDVPFKNAQLLVNYLNRFDMVRDTNGLEVLPQFFQDQMNYGNRASKNYFCNNCKKEFDDVKTLGEHSSEAEVCPHCQSDDFNTNPNLKTQHHVLGDESKTNL